MLFYLLVVLGPHCIYSCEFTLIPSLRKVYTTNENKQARETYLSLFPDKVVVITGFYLH